MREHEQDREWLRRGEIVDAVEALTPGVNRGSISAGVSEYCINDPSRNAYAGRSYRHRPVLVTDDPSRHGKRYRQLTEGERRAFLESPREDLDHFSYLQVVEWLGDTSLTLEGDEREPPDAIEITGPVLLEKHLQDYLFRNWTDALPGLQLYNGAEGREYVTRDPGVGTIDFLCTDADENFVIVETKRDLPDRYAIGQALGYMGWVTERLAGGDDTKVRGILIASEASDALRLTLRATPNLDLWLYEISFSLQKTPGAT